MDNFGMESKVQDAHTLREFVPSLEPAEPSLGLFSGEQFEGKIPHTISRGRRERCRVGLARG